MGVAADDCRKPGSLWVEVNVVDIVNHVQVYSCQFNNLNLAVMPGPRLMVNVAANGGDRGNFLESRNNVLGPDVSGVDDVL